MKRIAPIVIACLLAGATAWLTSSLNVLAGFGTVNYVTSGSATFQTTTNSSGQNLAAHTLWDAVQGQFGLSIDQSGRAATSAWQGTSPWFVTVTNGAGTGSTGTAAPSTAAYVAGDAQSSEPALATTGNLTGVFLDLVGHLVNLPYANRENMVRGAASTATSNGIQLIAAQGASVKIYITSISCGRTDTATTPITIAFNDTTSATFVLPNNGGGGGNNHTFPVPLVTAANAPFAFQASSATNLTLCNAQGFKGY